MMSSGQLHPGGELVGGEGLLAALPEAETASAEVGVCAGEGAPLAGVVGGQVGFYLFGSAHDGWGCVAVHLLEGADELPYLGVELSAGEGFQVVVLLVLDGQHG